MRLISIAVLSLFLFSLWAAFALLIINPFYKESLPGYTLGRICPWEGLALLIAIGISSFLVKKWGLPQRISSPEGQKIALHPGYFFFLLGYLLLALIVGGFAFYDWSSQIIS